MTHRHELLSAMLDGELSEPESAWVAEHLDECGECRTELGDLASARAAVRSLPTLDLPDEIRPPAVVVAGPWLRRIALGAASVAALAVVAVGALGMLGMAGGEDTLVDFAAAEMVLAAKSSLAIDPNGSPAGEVLTSGSDASFQARQTTACMDGSTLVDSTVDITRVGDVTVMSDPLAHFTVLVDGSISTGSADGPVEMVTVNGVAPTVAAGYSVASVERDSEQERPVDIVTLVRDGVERARLWIDVETGVIVQRDLLTASGEVGCLFELAEFEPLDRSIQASIPFDIRAGSTERTIEPVDVDMPRLLAGLELLDVYEIDHGIVAVYGDGLFLAAVMRVEGGDPVPAETQGPPAVLWEADGESWAIIGDIPEDLREAMGRELPTAAGSNAIVDGWRRLFG
jgi:hypothetical protein